MYKAKESFTTKDYDVRRGQILAEDFTTQDEITEFLNIGYIEEYDGSIDITENGTYDVTDYEQAVVDVSGGGGSDLDWTALGYAGMPQDIIDNYNYAKSVMNGWTPAENLSNKFISDTNLHYMPLVDTSIASKMTTTFRYCSNLYQIALLDLSKVYDMYRCFSGCSNLKEIPKFNTKSVKTMFQCFMDCTNLTTVPVLDFSAIDSTSGLSSTFANDAKLTNQSVDNILQSCISATSYTGTKTLAQLGFASANYPASTIQALPHYQDFIDAGWTIGY